MKLRPVYVIGIGFVVLCIVMVLLPKDSVTSQPQSIANSPQTAQAQDSAADEKFKSVSKQTDDERKLTLESVRKIDGHPLYFMKYTGDYVIDPKHLSALQPADNLQWACSIFFSYADTAKPLYGRNFDWQDQPVVVLFTDPPNRYASVSMVDVSYIGFAMNERDKFDSVDSRSRLVEATQIPFDGMNEHGLTVGMAAVGDTEVVDDPDRPNVRSLQIIRLALDTAKNTAEAIDVFRQYDIEFRGGPNIHYLIADPTGHSVLIEIKDGKVHLHENQGGSNQDKCWQSATNFYMTGEKNPAGQCWRFNKIQKRLSRDDGVTSVDSAMSLLRSVAQGSTRWSVVYDMATPAINIVMSRKFKGPVHRFVLDEIFQTTAASK